MDERLGATRGLEFLSQLEARIDEFLLAHEVESPEVDFDSELEALIDELLAQAAGSPEVDLLSGIDALIDRKFQALVDEIQARTAGPQSEAAEQDGHHELPNNQGDESTSSSKQSSSEDDESDEAAGNKACIEVREETNLWPTVKRYIKDPSPSTEPAVSCPICYVDLAIRGLPSQTPCPWKLSNGVQKVGVVLADGHMLCQECAQLHFAAQIELQLNPTCPLCRTALEHSYCLHSLNWKRLPIGSGEGVDIVPLTFPELPGGGDDFPGECLSCQQNAAREYLRVGFSYVGVRDAAWESTMQDSLTQLSCHIQRTCRKDAYWEYRSPSDVSLQVAFIDDAVSATLPADIRNGCSDAITHCVSERSQGQAVWYVPVSRQQGLAGES